MLPERLSANADEILGVLQETHKKKRYILLWQNVGGKRIVLEALIKSVQKDNQSIVLEPKDPKIKLETKSTIYAKGEVRNILFKETLNFSSSQLIILPIPKDIRVDELRKEKRLNYKNGEKVVFTVKNKLTKALDVHERYLVDVSSSGLSFTADLSHIEQLNVGDSITLSKVGMLSFEPRFNAVITYIKSQQQMAMGKKTLYRVGVKFVDKKLTEIFH